MPKVVFVLPDGHRVDAEAETGVSAMKVALQNRVRGIVAECGGSMMCATCHVYVDVAWVEHAGAAGPVESEMLDCTGSERRPESRLSCQVIASDELDGIVLHVPPLS